MITWMQTHRKWLVITIWIATIAFLGAGFVGWGAYSYGKKEDTIAVVKDTEVTMADWQSAYNDLFQKYNQMFGGKLDDKTAKKLGLDNAAFKQAIQSAILKQFAKDNGLLVTDEEVAKVLATTQYFFKDGKFDKKTYKEILKRNGMKPSTYEAKIKNDLLIRKILLATALTSTPTDLKSIGAYELMSDKVSIKTIDANKIHPKVTEKEIKKFWEQNKDNYKSQTTYNISFFYSPLNATASEGEMKDFYSENRSNYKDENGKILPYDKAKEEVKKDLIAKKSKREAIINYKRLKSDKIKFQKAENVSLQNKFVNVANMNNLLANNEDTILKPVLTQKGYLIVRLDKINKPTTLSYEEAKAFAKEDLIKEKKREELIKLAQNALKNFKGKNIGFISKSDATKLRTLSSDDANAFITALFASQTPKNFVLIPEMEPSKAIVFNITEQKLLDDKKFEEMKDSIKAKSDRMLNAELIRGLLSSLQNKYKIKSYIKDKN